MKAKLSNIIKSFNETFGTLFTDADRVANRIRNDIAPKVAAPGSRSDSRKKPNGSIICHYAHPPRLSRIGNAQPEINEQEDVSGRPANLLCQVGRSHRRRAFRASLRRSAA